MTAARWFGHHRRARKHSKTAIGFPVTRPPFGRARIFISRTKGSGFWALTGRRRAGERARDRLYMSSMSGQRPILGAEEGDVAVEVGLVLLGMRSNGSILTVNSMALVLFHKPTRSSPSSAGKRGASHHRQ